MTDFEALMWTLDSDPRLSSTIGNLTLLDRAPDWERLQYRMERATYAVHRLRQYVHEPPGRIAPPQWVYDNDFDLDRHLLREVLRPSTTRRQLLDHVMERFSQPFDRTRPLWEFVVFEGLRGGRAAMLQRIHHTLMDGEGGLRISEQFIDFARDAKDPPPLDPTPPGEHNTPFGDIARQSLGRLTTAARSIGSGLAHPGDAVRAGAGLVEITRSTLRQARFNETMMSPVWTGRSLRTRLDIFELSLDQVRAAGKRLGGTINDVFVTGAAEAAGRTHRDAGSAVDELRMAMPISTRSGGSAGGNHFSPSQTLVPCGDMGIIERFDLVHTALSQTRGESAMNATEALAGAFNLLPPMVLTRLGYRLAESVDFVTSNLRAAPFEVYLAGAKMTANHPIGPIAGTAFNMTTMSYCGRLCVGVVTDTEAVSDPDALLRHLKQSYRELLAARR